MRDNRDPVVEDALRQTNERLAAAIAAADIAVFNQDRELRYTWVHNPALGRAPDDVIGKRDGDLFERAEDAVRTEAIKRAVLETGIDARQEVPVMHQGVERYYDLMVRPQRDAAGAIIGVTCTAIEITERRRVEASARAEERLRSAHDTFRNLVDRSPFGIYVVDADFRLVQVSAGAQKVFEQVRPLLGRDFAEVLRLLWPEPFANEAIAIFRHTLATGEPYHAPSTVEKRQDIGVVESYDWKTERLMLPDGRWGVVCHFYDLSERQRFEAELRDADRQKDLFLAMLAHELRNPLAPIRTAAAVLRTGAPAKEVVTACADTIERQSAQMARLLDDLLDVSRLSRGRLLLQRAPVSLAEVLAVAVETSRPSLDAHRQQFSLDAGDEGLVVEGDGVRLAQVFANLLHNASKFGVPGGRIAMQARREGNEAVVRVKDSGIGIPQELLSHMFELFVQGPAERGGLGIGLSLAQRLVEMHGGEIAAHSEGAGRGSEFTVRLPLTSAVVARDHDTGDQPPPSARKVLIVDDNVDVAEITALLMRDAGCEVRVAYDGATALDTAQAFRPEVVFMDLGMPGLDGYEACRRIRASSSGRSVQMVAVSGWARPEDQQRSAAAGFDLHLVKPVEPSALIRIVRS